jgi:predicted outer membrane repeat protein
MFTNKSISFCIEFVPRSISFLLLVMLLFLGGSLPSTRAAASILYAKPEATGLSDCSTWQNACTLQQALSVALGGDQIWVMAGRYIPTANGDRGISFQLKNGVIVYGGFNGTESSLDQRDWLMNTTTLSGDLNGDDDGFTSNEENSYNIVKGATLATLDGFTISGGNGYSGSGIYNLNVYPTYRNLIITGNAASFGGGGMINDYSSSTLINVTFKGNTGGWDGGGLLNINNSDPTLINVTFIGNTAGWGGGAIYNGGSCDPTLTNVTLHGNNAQNVGGMFNYGGSNPTIRNSILWGDNNGEIYNDFDCLTTITYSDVQGGYVGIGNIDIDPKLIPLQDNGGLIWMVALQVGSQAIDAGDNQVCPLTDQRGAPRPFDGNGDGLAVCDMGAYESEVIAPRFFLPVIGRWVAHQ